MVSSVGENAGTMREAGPTGETGGSLCPICAAACNHLTGVRATDWVLRPGSAKVDGLMRWSMYEAISAGTEALEMLVAQAPLADVRAVGQATRCVWLTCPVCATPD